MKKLILLELAILFLATTFQSDNPPGWYQQTLPVNDFVNDIFFLDSLNGWVVTKGRTNPNDTGYILKTNNGGSNWQIQFNKPVDLKVVFMVDTLIGYVGGGSGGGTRYMYKTINGGISWDTILGSFATGSYVLDISFINIDTGWYCDDDDINGGVFKTTTGGVNWVRQLNETFRPTKLFFLNKDTGWASCNMDRLYRTTNGGINWNLQFTFPQQINDIFFFNNLRGIVTSGVSSYTTDGGFNWVQSNDGGIKLSFGSDTVGWAGNNLITVIKTTNGGINWFRQLTNINNPSVSASDNLNAWAGGNGIVHTKDGGGITSINSNESIKLNTFILNQNYPNPFNPRTIINYELRITGYVKLKVFDIQGKEIAELVNSKQGQGNYKVDFDGSGLSSGVYFYEIKILDEKSNNVFTDTKKLVLIR